MEQVDLTHSKDDTTPFPKVVIAAALERSG
jgi:hypothetical protein